MAGQIWDASRVYLKPFVIFLATALLLPLHAKASPQRVYYLHQRLEGEGSLKIYAGASGSKVNMNRVAIYLPVSSKDALVFNPSNHKYCVLDQRVWLAKLAADNTVSSVRAAKTAAYHGHQATQYFGETPDASGKSKWRLEFWAARDFNIPRKVQDDYCRLLGLPPGYGVPLAIIRHYTNGRNENFLGTYEITVTTVDTADLAAPTRGYQLATDEMDVIFGD